MRTSEVDVSHVLSDVTHIWRLGWVVYDGRDMSKLVPGSYTPS